MIDYLRGRLAAVLPGRVILEVGGVGLSIEIPASSFAELAQQAGSEVTLYTRLVLKEDEICLYGFRSEAERNLFNLVTGVSGFGPRLALALIGSFTASQFCTAVLEENTALLCQAPGVGRKGAQRLVLELKEKLPKVMGSDLPAPSTAATAGALSPEDEVVEALCTLGYTRVEALAAVKSVSGAGEEGGREELLKRALKSIGGR
ncbi:MAG TPA: Holliday junction branch migration protein RuvA [Bacillota bacterium]|nr:Holliday junction branch migration protein RuvA [Bacillota bacterium]